jgi:hypothetical protein
LLKPKPPEGDSEDTMAFNNCCLTITDIATPDPFVVPAFGKYYMVRDTNEELGIRVANLLMWW